MSSKKFRGGAAESFFFSNIFDDLFFKAPSLNISYFEGQIAKILTENVVFILKNVTNFLQRLKKISLKKFREATTPGPSLGTHLHRNR